MWIRSNNKRHWADNNGCHLFSEWRSKRRNSILNRVLLKTLFLTCHVLPFTLMIADLDFFCPWLFYFIQKFCFECYRLVHGIYGRGGPSSYVYCVVYFCIDVTPCTRSVNSFFWLFYTSDDELEHPWTMSISIL